MFCSHVSVLLDGWAVTVAKVITVLSTFQCPAHWAAVAVAKVCSMSGSAIQSQPIVVLFISKYYSRDVGLSMVGNFELLHLVAYRKVRFLPRVKMATACSSVRAFCLRILI